MDEDCQEQPQPGSPDATPSASGTVGPRRLYTERCRQQLAEQYLLGMPITEMAAVHGEDPKRISKLFRTKEMQSMIEQRRGELLQAGAQVMFKFLLHADTLAQQQLDCALSQGPDQYKARTWILERIAPARSTSQSSVDVNVNVHAEVMGQLAMALQETAKVLNVTPSTGGIALLDGKNAMPPSSYEMPEDVLEQ